MKRTSVAAALILPVLLAAGLEMNRTNAALSGRGVGELSLDRVAIRSLVVQAMPRNLRVPVPAMGTLEVHLDAPEGVFFHENGIEAEIRFRLEALGASGSIQVRYVPDVEPKSGRVRLRAEKALADAVFPAGLDLAPLLPPVELPRRFAWNLNGLGGRPLPVTAFVQGVRVTEDRVVVLLAFASPHGT
ncbi:MAG: hypothetical protein ACE5HD_08755 [Acidobacteriota bacterium]